MSQRSRVINLYKTILYLGREHPKGYEYVRKNCKEAFMKNRDETDPTNIKRMIYKGEYVVKEIEAMYALKKYRTMKKRYYDD